jgi:hypothetical protein
MTKLIALIAAVLIPGGAVVAYIFGRSKSGKAADRARISRAFNTSTYKIKSIFNGVVKYFSQLFVQKQVRQAA